jgi:hypothetical protein
LFARRLLNHAIVEQLLARGSEINGEVDVCFLVPDPDDIPKTGEVISFSYRLRRLNIIVSF